MKRRTILAGIGAGTTTIAGCMGSEDSDDWNYSTTCNHRTFLYRYLPENAKKEVDTAFSEGKYETESNLYYERLLEQPQEQALEKDDTYYVANIESVSKKKTVLTFEEIIPTLNPPATLSIRNQSGKQIDFEFTLEYSSGGVVDPVGCERMYRQSLSLAHDEVYSRDVLDKYMMYELSFYFESREDVVHRFNFANRRGLNKHQVEIEEDQVSRDGPGADGDKRCPWAPPAASSER